MEIVFVLLPVALLLGFIGLGAFFWAVKKGQFDDLDTPPFRALLDDERNITSNETGSNANPEYDSSHNPN